MSTTTPPPTTTTTTTTMTPTIIHNTMNNNKLKSIHQFNRPPQSYSASYSSLPESLDDTEEYPCKQLLAAALLQPATCSVSNFTVTTPFKPKAWAYRLAATRYPFPAAHRSRSVDDESGSNQWFFLGCEQFALSATVRLPSFPLVICYRCLH